MEASLWAYIASVGVWGVIWREAAHFALSATAGWLAYWWILTTRPLICSGERGAGLTGALCTNGCCWLLVLSFSVTAHLLEDYALGGIF